MRGWPLHILFDSFCDILSREQLKIFGAGTPNLLGTWEECKDGLGEQVMLICLFYYSSRLKLKTKRECAAFIININGNISHNELTIFFWWRWLRL